MYKRLWIGLIIAVIVIGSASQLSSAQDTPPRPMRDRDTGQLPIGHAPEAAAAHPAQTPSVPAAPLSVTGMAAWSKLTYQSYIGSWDIFAANGDGTNALRLTSAGEADVTPRFNRGATRIAYASREPGNYEIYTFNPNGSGRVRVTNHAANDYNPAWSPDGSKIVFNSYRDGQSEIYVMAANGANPLRLTYDVGYDGQPAWSPDGTQIAFLSDRSGSGQIWVMGADGHGPSQLTALNYAESPTWSPDGRHLAFDADSDGDGWQELLVMDANGSNLRLLGDTGTTADMWARSWSPDGRAVAFTAIYYVYYYGNWYWTAAYSVAADTVAGGAYSLGGSDTDWYPDWQTTDVLLPTSSLTALPATSASPFMVQWSGADAGPAGILGYDVQVKDGAGAWTMWLTRTVQTSGSYPGLGGHTYSFRVRAVDNSSNLQAWPVNAQASTTVEALPPVSTINSLPAYQRGELPVSWGGSDPGGSGIQTYDVQYRDGITGTWMNWQSNTALTTAAFTGDAGHTYYFRARAIDRAQNLESWPVGDNRYSTKYTWLLSGQATDSRDVSVLGVSVSTTPSSLMTQASQADAVYRAYGATDSRIYSLTWDNPAYGSLPATRFLFNSLQDAQRDVVMPPADNAVNDAGFERGLFDSAGWSATGTLTPVVVADLQYTGRYAVRLGNPPLQFAPPLTLSSQSGISAQSPQITVDDDNRLHVVWQAGNDLYYRWHDGKGSWSAPENLSSADVPGTARIVIDRAGTLHAMWSDIWNVRYKRHDLQNGWSDQQTIADRSWADQSPQFSVDDRGQVHAVWEDVDSTSIEIFYAYRNTQGVWSIPQSLSPGYSCQHASTPRLATDHNEQVHLVYECGTFNPGTTEIVYQLRNSDGQWSERVNISNEPYHSLSPLLAVDEQGVVHATWLVVWNGSSKWSYAQRSVSGIWTAPFDLPGTATAARMQLVVDTNGLVQLAWVDTADGNVYAAGQQSNGSWIDPIAVSASGQAGQPRLAPGLNADVHLAWSTTVTPTQEVFYTHRDSTGDWLLARNLSNSALPSVEPALTVDGNGDPHLAWVEGSNAEIVYAGPPVVVATNESSIFQVVTIPLTCTSPTLSLLYHLDRTTPLTGTWLSTQIDDGSSAAMVFSTTASTQTWQHYWFDVSQWAGQSLTLTLALHQTAGDSATRAYIDDVTLGSWLTPDPQALTPAHITTPATQVITITGDNFFATPQVRLNDVPLPDVTWIDTTTLTATVPVLPFGRYDLIVTNPGGQASGLPRALLVGYEVMLPIVRK
ncbi:MAG: PD40 domain-containing protein [Thermoflexales bacterium]|nr:PD40 domain-containing protein [Thermoflexales bacterium]